MERKIASGIRGGKFKKRTVIAAAIGGAIAAFALTGCGGGSPVAGAVAAVTGSSSPAGGGASGGTDASPSYSAAGVAASSDSATCQQMASAWATFTAQEQQKPGSGYPALETTLYNLSNYFNLDTVTQAISNLYGDVDSMVAYFNGSAVPASPGVADPDDVSSFDSDSKVVAKDCGISLPLPKSAQANG